MRRKLSEIQLGLFARLFSAVTLSPILFRACKLSRDRSINFSERATKNRGKIYNGNEEEEDETGGRRKRRGIISSIARPCSRVTCNSYIRLGERACKQA